MTRRDERTLISGFTLPEILISLVIFSMVSLSAYEVFKLDHKVLVEQEEVADMQQNARIAIDQLIRDLRMAGAGVPVGGVTSDIGFLYPVIPKDGGGDMPDTVAVLSNFTNVTTSLSDPMPNESANLKVADASEFEVGAIAIISGPTDDGMEAAEVFKITHISTEGQNMLQHRTSPPWNADQKLVHAFLPPSTIAMISYRKYYVDRSDSSHPNLMMVENEGTPEILADNVENLQFVYDLANGETDLPEPEDLLLIRKATASIVARTATPDPQWNNGLHSITGTPDHYRRLELSSDVQMRNLNR